MTQVATRVGPESSSTRSAADLADPARELITVPRPGVDETVATLQGLVAGGLTAVRAEWGVDGGTVLLAGKAPFADLTGRAGFRSDGALDGTVEVRARIGLLGLDVGDVTWQVDGWSPAVPLVPPVVTLRGTTLSVDLAPVPAGVWAPREGLESSREGEQATVQLPSGAVAPGEPLSPRLAEAYRGLLGVDPSGLRVHPDVPVPEAPAFVTDRDLFFAPGIYGVDSPDGLRVLDAAIRAALTGLFGPVTGEAAAPLEAASPSPPGGAPTSVAPTVGEVPDIPSPAAAPVEERTQEPAAGEPEVGAPVAGPTDATAGAVAAEGEAPPVVELIMPEPPTELSPAATARGGGVARAAGGAARAATDLPSADATVADSREAVTEPAAETAARAREELAAELGERPAPSPEIVELAERIRTAIRENRPEDEDELLESDPTREANTAGASITGSVEGQVEEVGSSYDAMSSPPAGTPALTPTPLDQPSPTSAGIAADAASAAPDPIPPENTTLDADVAATDQRIADSGIDTRVTQEIPDGPFAEARDARTGLGEVAQRTPQEIQAEQQQAIDSAQADMAALQQQAVAAMRSTRAGTVGSVGTGQSGMVATEESTRESVSARAQQIFDDAQRQVDALLQPLGRTAIARWEAGLTRLSQDFHDTLDRVKRWIDERHSGVGGTILAIGDYIGGLPDWVTDEYNRAERLFGDGVATLLLDISSDVNGVVAAAQAIVQHARSDIDAAFQAMEAEFPEWAAQERARFAGMLDGLNQRVTDSQTSFVRDVSARAITAVNEVHAEAQARRDEAGGLVGRVVAAIEEFIDDPVRAIINGLLRLVGIPPSAFWALIARIEQVISDIAEDPENFINNLVAGVKQGFQQFFDNFGTHVLRGFWDWLFSGLETPIPMPRDFSPASLFSFALQLMGITWPRVREILVRHVGPTAVEVIEAAWQLISVLIERGPEGIVEMIKEQLTPENIVNTILEAAVEYLMETLIQQVVVRVIGMLNPAGAIAQAIDLIYQVCSWIFRNAARIFRFVEAIVNGMADVIAGNIGGLANAVERALASLIPPVIDFLAGLLHLGGLPGEVAEVITRLQAMVYAAMDRVIGFLAERGRALLARMGIGGDDEEGAGNDDDELGTTVRFSAAGESHRVFVERSGSSARVMAASVPAPIADHVARWNRRLQNSDPEAPTEAQTAEAPPLISTLVAQANEADTIASQLAAGFEAAGRSTTDEVRPPDDAPLESAEQSLGSTMDQLFTLFGENDRRARLQDIATNLPPHSVTRATDVLDNWKADYINAQVAPVNGSPRPLWEADRYSPEQFVPTEVAVSTANHTALLAFFDTRRTGGADTAAFRDYALVELGHHHPVRRQFLERMGARVAAHLRTEAAGLLAGTDSRIQEQVRALRYSPGAGSGVGSFTPRLTAPVNVLIHSVIVPGGPLNALRGFVVNRSWQGVSYEQFRDELLADRRGHSWAANQLRQAVPGMHEWIPVSLLGDVLGHAMVTSLADTQTALNWITLMEHLRTPTDTVIYRILRPPELRGGVLLDPEPGVQLHPGAASAEQTTLVHTGITEGTKDFHDELRRFFGEYRSLDPAAWVDALLAHLRGELIIGIPGGLPSNVLNAPVNAYFEVIGRRLPVNLTVAQLSERQQEKMREIEAAFTRAKGMLR